MPVIFASSVLTLPQTLGALPMFKDSRYFSPVFNALRWGEPLYTLLYAIGIIFFRRSNARQARHRRERDEACAGDEILEIEAWDQS